ncbi:MAG: SDR family oxidoreductase [Geminicoccaceae bacterium]|nr:SDR family oxidoreductase [Geminicoccaceae bacterium]
MQEAGAKMFDLTDRTALVSGASRGIGEALAAGLARAGADVVVTARSRAGLDALCEVVRGHGRKALPLAMDVLDEAAIDTAFSAMNDAGMRPDILVNNAGMEKVCPSVDVSSDLFDRILGTNLRGAFLVARNFARPLLAEGRTGAIINLCSLTSEIGVPTATPYTASKSGLLGMTRALAAEWAQAGIRVNGIGPGYFRTELTEAFYADRSWQDAMLAKIPMRRFGQLEDLVGSCVFLASPAAAYITGQVIYVDGGYLASI